MITLKTNKCKFLDMNIVNPIATILSVVMMLRYSLSLEKEAKSI